MDLLSITGTQHPTSKGRGHSAAAYAPFTSGIFSPEGPARTMLRMLNKPTGSALPSRWVTMSSAPSTPAMSMAAPGTPASDNRK